VFGSLVGSSARRVQPVPNVDPFPERSGKKERPDGNSVQHRGDRSNANYRGTTPSNLARSRSEERKNALQERTDGLKRGKKGERK